VGCLSLDYREKVDVVTTVPLSPHGTYIFSLFNGFYHDSFVVPVYNSIISGGLDGWLVGEAFLGGVRFTFSGAVGVFWIFIRVKWEFMCLMGFLGEFLRLFMTFFLCFWYISIGFMMMNGCFGE
jgi:hypothetical protein